MTGKINVMGYVRVSTETQVKHGQGLDIQMKEIQNYCKKNDYNLLNIYVDAGISGSQSIENRKQLSELLIECNTRNGKGKHSPENIISKVIIQKMDRLARDTYQYLWIEGKLNEMGVTVESVNEEMFNQPNDPIIQALKEMVIVFSKMEKSIIANRLSKGRTEKSTKGIKPCGTLPYGYKYNSKKEVVIDKAEAKVVQEVFDLYSKGYGYTDIARQLNSQNIKTKRNKPWSKQGISVMVNNDFYTSVLTYKQNKIQGIHSAIISMDKWNQIKNKNHKSITV